MKTFIRCWLIAMLITAPAAALAANCRAVVVRHNVVEKVVVKEVVPVTVVPVVATFVPVAVPIYNTQFYSAAQGYAPAAAPTYSSPAAVAPAGATPCPDQSAAFKQIAQLMLQLDGRLSKLEGGGGGTAAAPGASPMPPADPPPPGGAGDSPPPAQPPGADRLLALATRHCAACHDKGRATASGKGFVLLEGGKFSASLSPDSLGKIIDEVSSKRMPKGGQMSDAERLEFVSLLVSGK